MQPTLKATREEIERSYDVIHGGNPTELRVLQPSVGSGTFNDRTKLVSTALNLSQRADIPGTFWTIQKLKDASSTNTWAWRVASTNGNDDIDALNWAILDCDPRRGSEISSTDAEKVAALAVAEDIRAFLNVHAIPHVFADSGNGWHLLVPIHVLNQNGGAGLVKRLIDAFSARYSTDAVFVDTKVANPARILKVYGTAVRKGQHSDERPHRLSRIVDAPEIASRLDDAQLKSLLANVLEGLPPEQQEKLSPVQSAEAAPADAVEFSMQELKAFLEWGGVSYTREKQSGDLWMLVMPCIFDHASGKHANDESWVGVNECAAKRFKCVRCDAEGGKSWNEFRAEVERRKDARYHFAPPPEDPTEYQFSAEKKPSALPDALDNLIRANILWNGTIDSFSPFILTDALGNYLEFASRAAAIAAHRESLLEEHGGDIELVELLLKRAPQWKASSSVLGIEVNENIEWTERGNALHLLKARGRVIRYVPGTGWMGRGRSFWFKDVADSNIREHMDHVLQTADFSGGRKLDEDAAEALGKWRRRCQTNACLTSSISRANALPQFRTVLSEFDADPLICNLLNCVLRFDKNTGAVSVSKHNLDDMTTFAMPVSYDPKATCPKFEAFLAWMIPNEEERAYLQTYIGLCLTGLKTRAFLTMVGVARNGKSVLNKVLAGLFGSVLEDGRQSNPYYVTCKMNTLTAVDEQAGGARADIVRLDAARIISAAESNKSTEKNVVKFNLGFLKAWTGGDPSSPDRGLYEAKTADIRTYGKFFIFTNFLPEISETGPAAWERVAIIECTSVVSLADEDPQLHEKLLTERSGILNWALRGLAMYFANGQKIPKPGSMQKRVEQYRMDDDVVRQFLQDQCREAGAKDGDGDVVWTRVAALYHRFKTWHEEEVGPCYTKQREFAKRVEEARGVKSVHQEDGKHLPVALNVPPLDEEGQPAYQFGQKGN